MKGENASSSAKDAHPEPGDRQKKEDDADGGSKETNSGEWIRDDDDVQRGAVEGIDGVNGGREGWISNPWSSGWRDGDSRRKAGGRARL